MMAGMVGGVKIVGKSDNGLELHRARLKQLLNNSSIGELPLVIVAIAGEARKGKSFIMNFFMRYLKNKGFDGNDWIQSGESISGGFVWRGGMHHVTDGILMWDEPFIIETTEYGKVAVLFVDTQGLYTGTEKTLDTKIFALSVLMSSCFIFNLQEEVDTRDLEFIEYFSSFAKRCFRWEEDTAPFQRLTFLVRDAPEDDYGCEEGKKYLSELSQNHDTIKQISRYFKDVDCFLMPYPGEAVDKGSEDLHDIDEDFVSNLPPLMNFLLHPNKMVPKLVNGKVVKPSFLLNYLETCFQRLDSVEAKTLTEMAKETELLNNTQRFEEIYKDSMNKILDRNFLSTNTELENLHNDSLQLSLKYLDEQKMNRGDVRAALTAKAVHLYEDYRNKNEANKNKARNRMEKLVDEVTAVYSDNMNERCLEVLSDEDLVKTHDELKKLALDKYEEDERNHPTFREECNEVLNRALQTTFAEAKKKNEKRKQEEELKEEEKRMNDLVNSCLRSASDKLDEVSKLYVEKTEFKIYCEKVESKALADFQAKCITADETKEAKYEENLKKELKDRVRTASVMNHNNEAILKQRLSVFETFAANIHREAMAGCMDECFFTDKEIEELHVKIRDGLLSVLTEEHFPYYTSSSERSRYEVLRSYRKHLGEILDGFLLLQQKRNYIQRGLCIVLEIPDRKGRVSDCNNIIAAAKKKYKDDVEEACEVITVLGEVNVLVRKLFLDMLQHLSLAAAETDIDDGV